MGHHPLPVSRMLYWREWIALGHQLFGEDKEQWRFHCMHCGKPSFAWEQRNKWQATDKNRIGQWCPHCEEQAIPSPTYGDETAFRVLVMPGDIHAAADIPQNGRMIYTMPFWSAVEESPGDRALRTIVNLDDVVPDGALPPSGSIPQAAPRVEKPVAPPKAPTKKGGTGYGFGF